ncbi:MAG: MarR family transcriptional regulator [Microthrixaceae bacterium]|nr:MarR family transcriptional regulator [Microthrixaceae bacterium]MCO5314402.1 MarR family transcriptional regulator [Microthrixaceae bacterium]HPB45912.1 MarR family transcriptional regulator [Microthrixaceae bacterium]
MSDSRAAAADSTTGTDVAAAPSGMGDLDEVAASIRLAVLRLGRILRHQDPHELSAPLTTALLTLGRRGPMSLSELAAAERITSPTTSKIVDKLEGLGYVTKVADAHDRRVCRIAVTPQGAAEVDLIGSRRTAYVRRSIDALAPELQAALPDAVRVLEALVSAAGTAAATNADETAADETAAGGLAAAGEVRR